MKTVLGDDFSISIKTEGPAVVSLRFELASSSEYTIAGSVVMPGRMNPQGECSFTFSTMCYGYDLKRFAESLDGLTAERSDQAEFVNSMEDVRLILKRTADRVSGVLTYRHVLSDNSGEWHQDVFLSSGEFHTAMGSLHELAKCIRDSLRFLEVDCEYGGGA